MQIPTPAPDKLQHDYVGSHVWVGCFLFCFGLHGFFRLPVELLRWTHIVPSIVVVLIGVGKEISDYVINRRRKAEGDHPSHGVEWQDALHTIYGGLRPALCVAALIELRLY